MHGASYYARCVLCVDVVVIYLAFLSMRYGLRVLCVEGAVLYGIRRMLVCCVLCVQFVAYGGLCAVGCVLFVVCFVFSRSSHIHVYLHCVPSCTYVYTYMRTYSYTMVAFRVYTNTPCFGASCLIP